MPSLYEGVKAFIRHGHNVHFITCSPPLQGSEVEVDHSKEYIKEGIRIYQFSIPLLSALKRLRNRTFSPHPLIQLFQYTIHLFSEYTIWILFTIGAVFKTKRVLTNTIQMWFMHTMNLPHWPVISWQKCIKCLILLGCLHIFILCLVFCRILVTICSSYFRLCYSFCLFNCSK